MPTTGYTAGIDSSDLVFSYGKEVTWGTKPAIAFQVVRLLGESLSAQKSRTRPQEINALGYAAHGITTQVQATGDVNFAVSYLNSDAFFEGMLNGEFGTDLNISGITTDLVAVSASKKFTSTLGTKFDNIVVGQWIKVAGFSNGGNNGWHRVVTKTSGQDITVSAASTLVNETSSGATQTIKGAMLRNGTSVTSFYLQKKLASALFLNYPGSYISGGMISAQVGDFAKGSVSFLCANEVNNTSDQSTGAVTAAPANNVIDTVTGFASLQVDDAALSGVIQSIEVKVTKTNARAQYGIGSAAAVGMGRGTLMAEETISVYFTSFALYDQYKNETDVSISFRLQDGAGKAYVVTLPQVTLINPQIQAGGPDTDVLANFSFDAAQHATYGATIQIDKAV